MAEAGLIAQLYPYKDRRKRLARAVIKSSSYYCPPRLPLEQEGQKSRPGRHTRDSTEPPEEDDDNDDDDELATLPYLELRFSDIPRTSLGLVFGKDENTSDVVLPDIAGISRRHFALTYKNKFADGCHRLIVRDLGSTHGTAVTYDAKGDELRSQFDWIVDGFDYPFYSKKIIIKLNKLKFRLVVAHHDITSPAYVQNVELFRRGAAGAEDLFGGLGLQAGPETERNSGSHTPVGRPILLEQEKLGQGGFAVVTRHWNVSTGEEYACKQPATRRYKRRDWEKEVDIMKSVSHENIVRLCFWMAEPLPLLYLEYMPFGNLDDQHERDRFSSSECLAILCQSLSAVAYLHGRQKPIAHRDIKPENILVKHRGPDGNADHLHVALSDFGLSKAGSLQTFCGTQTYCAPEVRPDAPRGYKYTGAVDMWSLGVVVLRLAYGLPYPGGGFGVEWCEEVVREAHSYESDGLVDILQRMLVMKPEARCSAMACLHDASQLMGDVQDGSATPTQASYAGKEQEDSGRTGAAAALVLLREQYASRYSSIAADPDRDLGTLSGHPRFARSGAPPPDSTARKRTKRVTGSSSSSSSRHTKRRVSTSRAIPKSRSKSNALPPTSASSWNQESDSEGGFYDNCWMDPLHPLGGGSLIRQERPADGPLEERPANSKPCTPRSLPEPDWSVDVLPQNVPDSDQYPAGDPTNRGWTTSEQEMAAHLLQTLDEGDSAPPHDYDGYFDDPELACPWSPTSWLTEDGTAK